MCEEGEAVVECVVCIVVSETVTQHNTNYPRIVTTSTQSAGAEVQAG